MIIALQILAIWFGLNILALPVWMHFISLRHRRPATFRRLA